MFANVLVASHGSVAALRFIGPAADVIEAMGNKVRARDLVRLKLLEALQAFEIEEIRHIVSAQVDLLQSPAFGAGEVHSGLLPQVLGRRGQTCRT